MTTELSAALVQVRQAYRLLHGFHKRMNVLHRHIDRHLAQHGLSCFDWHPRWNLRPPYKAFFDGRWISDMLPGLGTDTVWVDQTAGGAAARAVYVRACADSGRVARGKSGLELDPETDDWPPAEEAMSCLWIGVMWISRTPETRTVNLRTGWWQRAGREPSKSSETLVRGREDDGTETAHVWLEVNLERLADEEAVQAHVLDEIDRWLAVL